MELQKRSSALGLYEPNPFVRIWSISIRLAYANRRLAILILDSPVLSKVPSVPAPPATSGETHNSKATRLGCAGLLDSWPNSASSEE